MKKPIEVKLTYEGYEKVKQDYLDLLARRPGVLTRMVTAREMGDLSENAGYHAAKEELGSIDRRLRDLKLIIRFADVVKSEGKNVVDFGSKVVVEAQGAKREYTIVGAMEADPMQGKMSDVSPIGSALIGKKIGEVVEVEIPNGKVSYKILAIKS